MQAHALNTIGTARVNGGDSGGAGDLERSLEIAERDQAPWGPRALGNQASLVGDLGDLDRSRELYDAGRELAHALRRSAAQSVGRRRGRVELDCRGPVGRRTREARSSSTR